MAAMFENTGVEYRMNIKARFGTTVCSLVAAGLGIAIIDEFTVAHGQVPGLKRLEIDAESTFHTYAAYRSEVALSAFADAFLQNLRREMVAASTVGTIQALSSRKP
jgi:DNA-binding transcriptional LysR family regulator